MPVTVSEHAKIEFSNNLHASVEQSQARTKDYVKILPMKGKALAYDGYGSLDLTELHGRFPDAIPSDLEFWRRKVGRREFGATVAVDANDIEEIMRDPSSEIIQRMVTAFNREFDRVVYSAMFADVIIGEDFDSTVTYANDGGVTVDATAGLTYEKLLEINENFIDNEVVNEGMVRVCMGITGTEHTDLMTENELTSGDYSRQFVVDKGYITQAAGIELIRFAGNASNPILGVSGGTRTTFAMAENAMVVGLSRDYNIETVDIPGKYHTKYIKITGVLGATRTEGKRIQKVTTTA